MLHFQRIKQWQALSFWVSKSMTMTLFYREIEQNCQAIHQVIQDDSKVERDVTILQSIPQQIFSSHVYRLKPNKSTELFREGSTRTNPFTLGAVQGPVPGLM